MSTLSMLQGPDEEEARESCSGGSDIQMAFPHQVDQIYANCNRRVLFQFRFFCKKPKVSVVKSLKSPLCELLGKSKGDQNFSMLLNPEEKVVKLFQGSSPRSTAFIFDLCLPISGLFLRISSPSLSVSSC